MPHLYPLPLQGVGGEDIEALPSYVLRLATAHGVSLHQMMGHLVQCSVGAGHPRPPALQASQPAALIRPNTVTAWLVETLSALEAAPIETLRTATLLPLREALSRSLRDFSSMLRWCPLCIEEQVRANQPAHFKLVWLLNDVTVCHHHRLPLRQTCRRCRKPLNSCGRWPSLAACVHCQAPLSLLAKRDSRVLDPQNAAPDLVRLIAQMAAAPMARLPAHAVAQALCKVFDAVVNTPEEIDRFRKLTYDDCLRYASSSEPMTLRTARRIAYFLEIPIYDLLRGGEETSRAFGFALQRDLPHTMRLHRTAPSPTRAALTEKIDQWHEREPVSLRQIAREIGTSTGALRYHCPKQAAVLTARWRQHLRQVRDQQRHAAMLATWTEIAHWELRYAEPMTRKGLLRIVRQKTKLPKHLLRKALAALYPLQPSD